MRLGSLLFVTVCLVAAGFVWGTTRNVPLRAQTGDIYTYLPLVQKPAVAVPTPVPTPPASNLPPIPNGDFEMGSTVAGRETAVTTPNVVEGSLGWQELRSLSNRPLIVQSAGALPITARSGNWFAWLGGDHNLGETVNHRSHLIHWDHFFLPANQITYLHLYYQIISSEQPNEFGVCDRDLINIWMNNILIQQGQICELTQTNGWTKAVVDLAPFAGQWVTLEFEMRTDYQNMSHLFIDDVSFQAAP